MNLYSRYIFTRTLTTFLGFASIFVCLIWFSRAISFVRYVTENGIKLSQFFSLFVLILPWLLLFIIPVSLLAAILLTYNRFIVNNELTVLKNSGLTKFALCRPILNLAMLCSIFCFVISFYLMPYANKKLRLSRIDFRNNYTSLSFNTKSFETINNLTIYAKDRDLNNNLYGILLYDERNKGYSATITAKKGTIAIEDSSALLYMESGTVQKFDYKESKSDILNFDNYVFNLTETKNDSEGVIWKDKERYLEELLNPNDDSSYADLERYRAEIHQRIIYPLLPLVFSLISLSCILYGQLNRSGNLKNIIAAIFATTSFLLLTLSLSDLIQSSTACTPLVYLNISLFVMISIHFLADNYHKKS